MRLPIFFMIAFTNNTILVNEHSAYHRISCGVRCPKPCKLNTALHIFFVCGHIFLLTLLQKTLCAFVASHTCAFFSISTRDKANLTEFILSLHYDRPGSLYRTRLAVA